MKKRIYSLAIVCYNDRHDSNSYTFYILWIDSLGHEWTATVKNRVQGSGCPYCSHRAVLAGFNDLASQLPDVAAEWSERNLPLTPDKVSVFANRKVWWKCKHGHEWNTLISTRSAGSKCPYCSGITLLKGFNDLATRYPHLAAEWSDKNPFAPDTVNDKSRKNVWWHCSKCGNEYQAVIYSRVNGLMCPVCADRAVLRGYSTTNSIIKFVKEVKDGSYTVGTKGEELCRIYADGKDAYCIEPGRSLHSGDTMNDSSTAWKNLGEAKRTAVNLAILFGKGGNSSKLGGTTGQQWIATQLIVWEIVTGCRNTTGEFKCTNTKYIEGICANDSNPGVRSIYNKISGYLANYSKIS